MPHSPTPRPTGHDLALVDVRHGRPVGAADADGAAAPPTLSVRAVTDPDEIASLLPLLLLAEPSERALRWSLEHLSDAVYRAESGGALAGAATMRWSGDPCEIVELGVDAALHGRGIGRALVAWLCAEAARRRKRAIEVGTGNASIGNLAFYQKCGFRFHHVRQDYFRYHRTPVFEHGIEVRDLVVFRRELGAER